jgi:hypothetical protein
MPLYCSREETLSCGNISTPARQGINRESVLIDCPVEVTPSPSDLDLCFVHTPRRADRSGVAIPALLELRDIALDPSQDCCMRGIDPSLGHHLNEIAAAQLVGDIPSDAENDDDVIEVATAKQWRCVRKRLIHTTDYLPDSAFAPEPAKVAADSRFNHALMLAEAERLDRAAIAAADAVNRYYALGDRASINDAENLHTDIQSQLRYP